MHIVITAPIVIIVSDCVNPLMPSGAFNICCPRDCVSRHNGGTSGAPLKPLRVDSALSYDIVFSYRIQFFFFQFYGTIIETLFIDKILVNIFFALWRSVVFFFNIRDRYVKFWHNLLSSLQFMLSIFGIDIFNSFEIMCFSATQQYR